MADLLYPDREYSSRLLWILLKKPPFFTFIVMPFYGLSALIAGIMTLVSAVWATRILYRLIFEVSTASSVSFVDILIPFLVTACGLIILAL